MSRDLKEVREVDYVVGRVLHIKVLRWSELTVMGCWERSSQKDNWHGVRTVGLEKRYWDGGRRGRQLV